MLSETQIQLGKELESIARELDISPTDYERAVSSYKAVGEWLEDGFACGHFPGSHAKPAIYPQGSIRLGTVVRPLRDGKGAAYDVDIVCELQIEKLQDSAENARQIKHQVGDRLKANEMYRQRLEKENKRCWTVEYAKTNGIGFHIDVLPCVPNVATGRSLTEQYPSNAYTLPDYGMTTIAITDKTQDPPTYRWSSSNPRGFAKWFISRNVCFRDFSVEQKRGIFEASIRYTPGRRLYASIDEVPDELVRTPLQRTVQIFKRHRDIYFQSRPEYKPISMIITTLAAQLYEGERDLYSTVSSIAERIRHHEPLLESRYGNAILHESVRGRHLISRLENGRWYIPNPVNPEENFADRWHEDDHARAKAFFEWVRSLDDLIRLTRGESNYGRRTAVLIESFGAEKAGRAFEQIYESLGATTAAAAIPHVEIVSPSKPWGKYVL